METSPNKLWWSLEKKLSPNLTFRQCCFLCKIPLMQQISWIASLQYHFHCHVWISGMCIWDFFPRPSALPLKLHSCLSSPRFSSHIDTLSIINTPSLSGGTLWTYEGSLPACSFSSFAFDSESPCCCLLLFYTLWHLLAALWGLSAHQGYSPTWPGCPYGHFGALTARLIPKI